jgi:hypothetical protein
MSAAFRTNQATPSMRPLGAAFGGILIAAAILALLAFGQPTATNSRTVPAAGAAPVLHDRGWATAPSAADTAPVLHDRGWATAPSAVTPSAAFGHSRFGGSGGPNGTRVAR